MKAKPYSFDGVTYTPCLPENATHIRLHAPGPFPNRMIPVRPHAPGSEGHCWNWNGDTEAPSLSPSLLTWTESERCHSFVTDGRIRYLQDCSHEFAGKVLELLEVE